MKLIGLDLGPNRTPFQNITPEEVFGPTFYIVVGRGKSPCAPPLKPYGFGGVHEPSVAGHSVTMILINTAATIRRVISDPALDHQIQFSIDTLSKYFIHPEYKALLETVGPEGELIDTLAGRTCNRGN